MQVGRDPRPVMREAYNMFKGGGDPEKVFFAILFNSELLFAVYEVLLALFLY